MDIKGVQKTSLIDYPGKMSAVIFVPKCTFRCAFCYNVDLVTGWEKLDTIDEREVLNFLKDRKKWLDGIVVTGGEPTIHKDLPDFLRKVKELGYAVKLDTNGTNPYMLEDLIKEGLVDYLAMDIKCPQERYEEICKAKVDMKLLKMSIERIKNSGLDYEFRTTVVPGLITKEDIVKIGEWMKGAKNYYIQQFFPRRTLDGSLQNTRPYKPEDLKEMEEAAKPFFGKVEVRK
jgi:pyruvate formate lyase activating enzyme